GASRSSKGGCAPLPTVVARLAARSSLPPPRQDGAGEAGARKWFIGRVATWVVGGAGAAVVLWLVGRSVTWPVVHDVPLMHYVAWRISEGAVPYRDVFDMNFPGVYLLHLLVVKTLGSGDAAWRAFDLGWLGLASLAVAALAAPWGRLAAAGGAAFFAAYHLGGGAWQAGQRDFLLCPFLLAGALGVARWGERGQAGALLSAGLVLGAGVMIKPHAALFALALIALVLLAGKKPR